MLRALILALLLANLGYFAWTQGWLGAWVSASPLGDRDPQRLDRQVAPETVVVLPPGTSTRAAPASVACIEAGPFDGNQIEAAEAALATLLPAGNWTRVVNTVPGTWIVYMGKYLDAETFQRKQAELRRIRVNFETVQQPPELASGLLLGRYDAEAAAEAALDQFNRRGVRTARVVPLVAPRSAWQLRIEGAEASLVSQVLALRNEALGRGFAACAKAAAVNGTAASAPGAPVAPASPAGASR